MDILYVVGEGSKWGNNELKYSLRSLEKYGKNYDRIFLTGFKPNFLNEKIHFLDIPDVNGWAVNHWNKVRQTFLQTDISPNILYMMDDVFFFKEIDLSDYPYYYKGELPETRNDNEYNNTLVNTREHLKYCDSFKNFTVHCPIKYDYGKFMNLGDHFYNFYKHDPEFVSVRSFYTNYYYSHNNDGYNIKFHKDNKVRKLENISIEDKIKEYDELACWSMSDEIIPQVEDYLEKNFPFKSKWEV